MLNELQESLNHFGKIYDGKIETKGKIEFADFFGGGGGSSSDGENSGNGPFMPTPLPEKNSRKLKHLHFCWFLSN